MKVLLAALIAQPTVADADKLTTPIVNNGSHWEASSHLSCFAQARDVPVKVTFIGYADQPARSG